MARSRAVGLDIGTRTVTLTQARVKGGQAVITDVGQFELPDGAVREGEIIDPGAVARTVKDGIGEVGIKEKKVNLGIANQRVVVRQVTLPKLPDDELRKSLPYQAQEFIPIPVDQAQLDYHVLDEGTDEEGNETLRVLLVAAATDMISNHVEVAQRAGLKPVGVDLNPFALLRALAAESVGDTSEVLVDIGGGVTSIIVHQGGAPTFVRILVLGGDDVTRALAESRDMSFEEAEQAKRQLGTDDGDDDVGAAVADQISQFADEVRSSLDYFRAQSGSGPRIDRVVLAGGGAVLQGLAPRLAEVLGLTVELARPFDHVEQTLDLDDELLTAYGPVLTTSIGLALGGLE